MNKVQLPKDLFLNNLLPYLSVRELSKLCQSDKEISELCNDEQYWRNRITKLTEDDQISNLKPRNMIWAEYYYKLSKIIIIVKDRDIETVWIIRDEQHLRELIDYIGDKYDLKNDRYTFIFSDKYLNTIRRIFYPSLIENYRKNNSEISDIDRVIVIPENTLAYRRHDWINVPYILVYRHGQPGFQLDITKTKIFGILQVAYNPAMRMYDPGAIILCAQAGRPLLTDISKTYNIIPFKNVANDLSNQEIINSLSPQYRVFKNLSKLTRDDLEYAYQLRNIPYAQLCKIIEKYMYDQGYYYYYE